MMMVYVCVCVEIIISHYHKHINSDSLSALVFCFAPSAFLSLLCVSNRAVLTIYVTLLSMFGTGRLGLTDSLCVEVCFFLFL